MTEKQTMQLVDQLAQTIRVHCRAERTRMEVSENWVMDLARNQVAAAMDLIKDIEDTAIDLGAVGGSEY